MQYRPRKHKIPPLSRARRRNVSVRIVRRAEPDIHSLARVLLEFTREQLEAERANKLGRSDNK